MCDDSLTIDRNIDDDDDVCGGTNSPTPGVTFTTISTADAVDANLAPITSEPVGARREFRDFDPEILRHSPSHRWDLLGRAVFAERFEAEFGDKPATTFLYPSDETDATAGKGLWATSDDPAPDAILIRIA